MKLLYNANDIASNKLKMNNVVSAYKSVKTAVDNNYIHQFALSLQVYITKLGLILNECVSDININAYTYLGSLDFICLRILNNRQLYKVMRVIDINDNGNDMKHNLKDLKIDIDFTLKQYNELISQIVKATKLNAFKVCYINRGSNTKPRNLRDVPIAEDQRHHKYFTVNNFQLQLKISPDYTVDHYAKVLCSKLTMYWPQGRTDCYADVFVKNVKTGANVAKIEKMDLSKNNAKHAFPLRCSERDLDRRVLKLEVTITLFKKKLNYYTTGILFWKQDHFYDRFEQVETKKEIVSQFFKPHQS